MMYRFIYLISRLKSILMKACNPRLFKGVVLFDVPKILKSSNVSIGEESKINSNVFIHADDKVTIGKNVTLSHGATILSTGYDLSNWNINKYEKEHVSKPIVIEDNVWIGANVTILSGVTIAEGVVVAAGSVVTKNLECDNSLYAGVPAKKIKDI